MLFLNRNINNTANTVTQNYREISITNTSDLYLDNNLDLALSPAGDLVITKSSSLIIDNLFRRLTTAIGGYERFFFNKSKSYVEYDAGWTDPLLSAVSAPITASLGSWAESKLRDVAEIDSRITILNTSHQVQGQKVLLKVTYTINNTADLQKAELVLPG